MRTPELQAVTQAEILASVVREALFTAREHLEAAKCGNERRHSKKAECVYCSLGRHGQAWVLNEQRCDCPCHQAVRVQAVEFERRQQL